MSFLHLHQTNETRVFDPTGRIIRTSKNLRGMLDYGRVSPVTVTLSRVDPTNTARGILRVTYANGCSSFASFASYHIMIDWVRNRRSWRSAEHIMQGPNMGYLTKPGIIAGK